MVMVNSRSKAVFVFLSFAICRIRSSNSSQQRLMEEQPKTAKPKKTKKLKKKLDTVLRF
jgi:hypothetical protein